MNIDFNAPINTILGVQLTQEMPDPDDPKKTITQDMTLRDYCVDALLRSEPGLDAKTSLTRYGLAKGIQDSNGFFELSVKENAIVQRQVAKAFAPLVVGQALHLLEGPASKE